MFHTVVFSSSLAQASTFNKISALQTTYENVQNNNWVVDSKLFNLIAVHGYGAHMSRLQIQAPSVLAPGFPDLQPINKAVPTNGIEPNFKHFFDAPIAFKPTEQFSLFAVQSNAGAETEYAAAWFADGPIAPTKGPFRTLRATGSTTLTAGAWTTAVPLTFEDNLPAGNYEVHGVRAQSATGLYARIGSAQSLTRPGCIMGQTDDAAGLHWFREGMMGLWFTFANTVQLTLDVLATGADTSEIVELDLIGPK